MATKDKRKAAIIAIKHSASDRAMLFSFYNHPPTTLGMGWWDKYQSWKVEPTRGRWEGKKSYYKRKNKQSRKMAGKKGQEEPPRLSRGERLPERTWFNSIWTPRLTTVRWPRPSLSKTSSTNYIVWALNVRTQYHFGVVTNWVLTYIYIYICIYVYMKIFNFFLNNKIKKPKEIDEK